jgi:hypothetical protein
MLFDVPQLTEALSPVFYLHFICGWFLSLFEFINLFLHSVQPAVEAIRGGVNVR